MSRVAEVPAEEGRVAEVLAVGRGDVALQRFEGARGDHQGQGVDMLIPAQERKRR